MKPRRVVLGTLSQIEGAAERVRAPHDRFAVWVIATGKTGVDVFEELPETTDDLGLSEAIFDELTRFIAEHRGALASALGPKTRAAFHFDAPPSAVQAVFENAGYQVLDLAQVLEAPPVPQLPSRRALRFKAPPVERRRSFYVYETPVDDGHAGCVFVRAEDWRVFLFDLFGLPSSLDVKADIDELASALAGPPRDRLWVVQQGVVREAVPLDQLVEVEADGNRATWTVNVEAVALPALVGKKLTKKDGRVPFAWAVEHDESAIMQRTLALGSFGEG